MGLRTRILVALLAVCAGCAKPTASYRCDVEVLSGPRPGQFEVAFTLYDTARDTEVLVACPRMLLEKDRDGSVTIGDEKSEVCCHARVSEALGRAEATTLVEVKREGVTVWSRRERVRAP